jgi:hypothetical protein
LNPKTSFFLGRREEVAWTNQRTENSLRIASAELLYIGVIDIVYLSEDEKRCKLSMFEIVQTLTIVRCPSQKP